jgi:hypothetical protein
MIQNDPDPFDLRQGRTQQVTVWMIARGVFWGQLMLIAFAFAVGFILNAIGWLAELFKFVK